MGNFQLFFTLFCPQLIMFNIILHAKNLPYFWYQAWERRICYLPEGSFIHILKIEFLQVGPSDVTFVVQRLQKILILLGIRESVLALKCTTVNSVTRFFTGQTSCKFIWQWDIQLRFCTITFKSVSRISWNEQWYTSWIIQHLTRQ